MSEPTDGEWLPQPVEELFGPDASVAHAYGLLTVDVPATDWLAALDTARSTLGCTYFDWLSAVDEGETGFRICAHLVALPADGTALRRLVVRTTLPATAPALPTATGVFAGAGWHERETHEMFGVEFTGHPHPEPLLLPDGFEGHPLRKDFVLAARVAKAWPGAKEPGESSAAAGHGGPKRRQMLPPGVPDPNEWGPLKGQLPPAPSRPARGRAAAGERPPRRARSASAGSASQQPAAASSPAPAGDDAPSTATPGAAPAAPATDRPTRRTPRTDRPRAEGAEGGGTRATPPARAADAPWHDPRPAFDDSTAAQAAKPAASDPADAARPEASQQAASSAADDASADVPSTADPDPAPAPADPAPAPADPAPAPADPAPAPEPGEPSSEAGPDAPDAPPRRREQTGDEG